MASLINASGATGTGSLTIQGPSTNSNQVLTIPDATGTAMVSGNMPAFSAYQSSAQTVSTNTATKITFDTKEFDTNSNFASSTFTPTVAGYYQVNAAYAVASTVCQGYIQLRKNGLSYKIGTYLASATLSNLSSSFLVYCNGATDYLEIYCYISTGQSLSTGSTNTYFQASMVRAA
jgi:hypothetical protein